MKIWGSIRLIFMNADGVDWMLMGLGLIGAIGDGFIAPIIFFFTGLLLNDIGGSFNDVTFMKAVSKVISFLSSFCSQFSGFGIINLFIRRKTNGSFHQEKKLMDLVFFFCAHWVINRMLQLCFLWLVHLGWSVSSVSLLDHVSFHFSFKSTN